MAKPRSFEEWAAEVPQNLKRDSLWNFEVYPKTLFLCDLAWDDCQHLIKDRRGRAIIDQLTRSTGSVCANIEEGYGRGYGKEYAYFLRVSIGSARESRGWYYRARRLLPAEVVKHRMNLLDEIIAMLVPNIQNQNNTAASSATCILATCSLATHLQPAHFTEVSYICQEP